MSEIKEESKLSVQQEKEADTLVSKVNAESESDVSSDEEIILDETSDTEDFVPKQTGENNDSDDESCSSGEEEEGIHVKQDEIGGQHFCKLVFEDVEANRRRLMEHSDDEDKENQEEKSDEKHEGDDSMKCSDQSMLSSPFKKYRSTSILDEDMEQNYKSDEDDNFDPVYCGETLSDIEYREGDERDTESEPETEEIGSKHKRTGEALISIKMIEELKLPPDEPSCNIDENPLQKLDSSMECS